VLPLPAELDLPTSLHGLSAFTTLRTRHGTPLLVQAHLARLTGTCAFLGLPAPDTVLPTLEALPWGLLRLTVTEAGTFWSHRPLLSLVVPASGVRIWLSRQQVHPQLGLYKTGNYLPYVLARREAEVQGAFEGLLSDASGCIVDGGRSGLLLHLGGQFLVPDGGLPSITRAAWLDELGETAQVSPVSPGVLRQAERIWLCGAGVGIVPVGQICGNGWEQGYQVQWPETQHQSLIVPGQSPSPTCQG
jgi:4-amino-4-deoxychorismate lyase